MEECKRCDVCVILAECDVIDECIDNGKMSQIHDMLIEIYNKGCEQGRADERAKIIGLLYETNMNCPNCPCNDECNFSKADCIEFLSKYISEMLGK